MSEQFNVHDPASRAKEKQYDESDVKLVLGMREWKNWDELISWLREEGDNYRRLTPGEVKHMVEDFTRLKEQGVQFTTDPHQLFTQARSK
jgi:hypothetical protein